MTPQQLKNSILQRAIEGRLTPADAPNSKLRNNEITKLRNVITTLRNNDITTNVAPANAPFAIPADWQWVKLGEIFQHNTGKALNGRNREGRLLPYITTSNLYWDSFKLENLKEMYFTDSEIEKCTVKKGDLLVCEGGDVGRAAIWNYDYEMRIQNHIHRLRPIKPVSVKFYYHMIYLYKQCGLIGGKGIGLKGLASKALDSILLPLPPLAVQREIVAKVDALLEQVEIYREAYEKLAAIKMAFPAALRKSLLQAAIEGRLTGDDAPNSTLRNNDMTTLRNEITTLRNNDITTNDAPAPADAPFAIPADWKWVKLGEVCEITMGQSPEGHTVSRDQSKGIEFHQGKVFFGDNYLKHSNQTTTDPKKIAEKNSILLCVRAPVGVVNITSRRISIGRGLCALVPGAKLDMKYLFYVLRALEKEFVKKATGTTFKAITNAVVKSQLLPLPPLAVQRAIVAKVEALLPLVDRLA